MEGGRFYRKFDILWELPVLPSSPLLHGPGGGSANDLRHANFSNWCRRFVRLNIAHRSVIHGNVHLPLEVFTSLPSSHAPERWTGSASAEESMEVARRRFASGEIVSAVLEELGIGLPRARRESLGSTDISSDMLSTAGTDGPGKTSGSKRPASPGIDDMAATMAELRQLSRYFPAVDKGAVFCVGCASYGHRVRFCPLLTCRICGSSIGEHGLFGCPVLSPTDVVFRKIAPLKTESNRKNKKGKGKGRGNGHEPKQDTEATDGPVETDVRPALKCKFCLAVTAHRGVCPTLWTTFVPNASLPRKAGRVSASCYVCGSEGHFGGDCKKNTGEHLSGRPFSRADDIWCQEYAMQFLGNTTLETQTPSAAQPAPAKRAKTSADQNTSQDRPSSAQAPTQAQSTSNEQPGGPGVTLSRAQIKKSNRRKRIADEARGAQAKQAAQAAQTHSALQTALPTRAGPPAASQSGPKQAPKPGPKPAPKTAPKPGLNVPQAEAPKPPQKQTPATAASKKQKSGNSKKAKKDGNGTAKAAAAAAAAPAAAPAAGGSRLPQQMPNTTRSTRFAQMKSQKKAKANAQANTGGQGQQARQINSSGQGPSPPEGKAGPGRRRRSKARKPGNAEHAGSQ